MNRTGSTQDEWGAEGGGGRTMGEGGGGGDAVKSTSYAQVYKRGTQFSEARRRKLPTDNLQTGRSRDGQHSKPRTLPLSIDMLNASANFTPGRFPQPFSPILAPSMTLVRALLGRQAGNQCLGDHQCCVLLVRFFVSTMEKGACASRNAAGEDPARCRCS